VAVPTIGASIAGGYYAGQISTSANGVATHYLIVSPKSSGYDILNIYYTSQFTPLAGTSSQIDGPSNTAAMVAAETEFDNYPAAQFVNGLTIGGYSDWYIPAIDELEVCYYNLKPTTDTNITTEGANDYSVPKRTSNYSLSVPGQTSATDFRTGNSQAFDFDPDHPFLYETGYWSSSVDPSSGGGFTLVTTYTIAFAAGVSFTGGAGDQYTVNNSEPQGLRAIRRVAV
jgi:hypothetical protein